MSMDYIRRVYGLAVKRGDRVRYANATGSIVAARGAYLRIRMDDHRRVFSLHPLDEDLKILKNPSTGKS